MENKRKAISKKVRFEVFKRDSFTCQYCGKSAPDVVLHVDHIHPVAKGGKSDPMNYVTACVDCNLGKGAKTLDDKSVLEKQKKQLSDLNERREQLKLMVQWKESLAKIDDESVTAIEKMFYSGAGFVFSDYGKSEISKLIKKYSFSEVYDAAQASRSQYVDKGDVESYSKAFNYIRRICATKKKVADKPYLKDLYYIRAIIRNRMYCVDYVCLQILEDAFNNRTPVEELTHIAKSARNWTDWKEWMQDYLP